MKTVCKFIQLFVVYYSIIIPVVNRTYENGRQTFDDKQNTPVAVNDFFVYSLAEYDINKLLLNKLFYRAIKKKVKKKIAYFTPLGTLLSLYGKIEMGALHFKETIDHYFSSSILSKASVRKKMHRFQFNSRHDFFFLSKQFAFHQKTKTR